MHITDILIPAASVLVAIITALGVIYTASKRKDPTTAEVWTENSNLRDRLDRQDLKIQSLEDDFETQKRESRTYRDGAERQITILGSAFDILFRMIGTHELTPADKAVVEQARALRTGTGSTPVQGVQ